MGSLTINDKLGDFLIEMEPGAIYWEWDDGVCIAIHKDVYEYSWDDAGNPVYPYKNIVDAMMIDYTHRIRRILYKSYHGGDDPWRDMINVYEIDSNDPYTQVADHSGSFIADKNNLKAVQYIASDYKIHSIEEGDGTDYTGIALKYYPIDDPSIVEIKQFSVENVLWGPEMNHLKNDLKVSLIDGDFSGNFDNSLIWLNGVFLPVIHDSVDNRILYIENGKSFITSHVIDYEDFGELTYTPGSNNATVEINPEFNKYRYDFDLKLFQWPGVEISPWLVPISASSETITYADPILAMNKAITFTTELWYGEDIKVDSHFIMLNGEVLSNEFYYVDPDNDRHIILKGVKSHVLEMLRSLAAARTEAGSSTNIAAIINATFPISQEYSLINFTSPNAGKVMKMRRSTQNYKNFPYPFHVTFTNFNLGDLILVDGVFEKYVLNTQNSIRYPLTRYSARWNDYNVLDNAKVERVYFYEKNE